MLPQNGVAIQLGAERSHLRFALTDNPNQRSEILDIWHAVDSDARVIRQACSALNLGSQRPRGQKADGVGW